MRDIQFITLADKISINSITDNQDTVTMSLRPLALYVSFIEILSNTTGLSIVPSSNITILSSTELRFIKPQELVGQDLNTLSYKFITSVLTDTDRADLIFNPTDKIVSVSGTQKLLQQVVKVLLTNAGSNRYNTEEGGDIMSFLGTVINSTEVQLLLAPVEDAVQRTKEFILQQQLGKSIPPSERLLSLEITDYTVTDYGELDIKVQVQTLAGDSINIPLSI